MLFFKRSKPIYSQSLLCHILMIILSLVVMSGCKSVDRISLDDSDSDGSFFSKQDNLEERAAGLAKRENALIAREAAISARESELVTLFAELLQQKEGLDQHHAQAQKKQTNSNAESVNPAPKSQRTKPVNQSKQKQAAKTSDPTKETNLKRTVLGGVEYVYLDPPGISLSARIDTGAQTSSLNALDMVEFERDGEPYIKFNIIDPETEEKIELTRRVHGHVKIKKHKAESQRRPIVKLRVKLGDLDEQISFTLADRSKFNQQVLVGRNLLRDLAIVDVSKKFTQPKIESNNQ